MQISGVGSGISGLKRMWKWEEIVFTLLRRGWTTIAADV